MQRPKITTVNHYDIFPVHHGGKLAIMGLWQAMSKYFDVNIITFVSSECYPKTVKISEHIFVFPVVVPDEIQNLQKDIASRFDLSEVNFADDSINVMLNFHKSRVLTDNIRKIGKDSFIVMAEHVYTWNIIKKVFPDKHLWYRAHNVEFDYKRNVFGTKWMPKNYIEEIYKLEKECCEYCECIMTISKEEADRFVSLYEMSPENKAKILNIGAGYDYSGIKTVLPSQRKRATGEEIVGIYIATGTDVSKKAAEHCIELARRYDNFRIVLIGSVGNFFSADSLPDNVTVTGMIPNAEKNKYLMTSDIAFNLVDDGAGVNIKMFEYFAYGIPVITTEHGLRGIEAVPGRDCIVVNTAEANWTDSVTEFCGLPVEAKDKIAENALRLLQSKYNWTAISENIKKYIERKYEMVINNTIDSEKELQSYKEITNRKPFIPQGDFYIRCAGNWGQACAHFLRSKNIFPVAYIDDVAAKKQATIGEIPVITLKEYAAKILLRNKVIIAHKTAWLNIAKELYGIGANPVDIYFWQNDCYIFSIDGAEGNCPIWLNMANAKKYIHET